MWSRLKGSARFGEELETWVDEHIISQEQAVFLQKKYETDASPPWYKNSSFILRSVGILIASMGLILLISANWDSLPIPVRMLMGLAPLLLAYGLGFKFLVENKKQAAELSFLFASLAFGANIALQAQIFHISSYAPNGLLWWILGALPIMLYFRSHVFSIIFMGLFMVWTGWQSENYQFSFWSIIIVGTFFYLIYTKPNSIAVLVSIGTSYFFLVNLMRSIEQSRLFRWYEFEIQLIFILLFPLFFLGIFYWVHEQYSETFTKRLQAFLLFVPIFMFYLLTFEDVSAELIQGLIRFGLPVSMYVLFGLVFGLFALQVRQVDWKKIDPDLYVGLGLALVLVALTVITPTYKGVDYGQVSTIFSNGSYKLFAIFINIAFFVYCIWKIYYGIQKQRKQSFMAGIFYLVVLAVSRYLILGGDYIVIAIIFIGAGIGIFFINNLWNKRYAK